MTLGLANIPFNLLNLSHITNKWEKERNLFFVLKNIYPLVYNNDIIWNLQNALNE